MKTFNTLKGFLEGRESGPPPYFAYSAMLRIFGSSLDFEQITQNLGLEPSDTHRKGDKKGPRSPGFPHDQWSYTAPRSLTAASRCSRGLKSLFECPSLWRRLASNALKLTVRPVTALACARSAPSRPAA